MNDLLFYAILMALIYYCFFYLPQQKKLNTNPPLKHHKATQTDELATIIDYEPGAISGPAAIPNPQDLQKQINTITHQLPTQKTNQNKEEKELEKVLNNLLKGIQELTKELN